MPRSDGAQRALAFDQLTELGRGPGNEPLVGCDRPVAWIADQVIKEAGGAVGEQNLQWVRSGARRPGSGFRG